MSRRQHDRSMASLIAGRGFTLIEIMTALLVLSLLSLMSYRGLSAVLEARDHVGRETAHWRALENFFGRLGSDIHLAAPRPVRRNGNVAPAWQGLPDSANDQPQLELSRFSANAGAAAIRRVAYRLNEKQEIELWLWPGLDSAGPAQPARYPLLGGVAKMEFEYLGRDLVWVNRWPVAPQTASTNREFPRAVRVRMTLISGEEIMRIFALNT